MQGKDMKRWAHAARALIHAMVIVLAPIDAAGALAQTPSPTPAATTTTPVSPGVVNVNTASEEELTRLPGVGPAKAAAIIEARERRPFRRLADLMRVSGIGRRTLDRLAPMIAFEGPTTLASRRR